MRQKLEGLNGIRRRFSGTFVRFGTKSGWKGRTETTVLLKDIKSATGNIVCDHLWFNLTKEFEGLDLQEGMVVAFDARVKAYLKGYRGDREEEVCVERDFKLSHPTKVQVFLFCRIRKNSNKIAGGGAVKLILGKEEEP